MIRLLPLLLLIGCGGPVSVVTDGCVAALEEGRACDVSASEGRIDRVSCSCNETAD